MTLYKIRDRATGLFSTGGRRPGWNKKGKYWNSMGTLRAHLSLVHDAGNQYRGGYDIVQFQVSEVCAWPIAKELIDIQAKKIDVIIARREAQTKAQEDADRRELERLKNKLGVQ